MKKFLAAALTAILALTLVFALVACGNESSNNNESPSASVSDTTSSSEQPDTSKEDVTISDEALKVSLEGHTLHVTSIGQSGGFSSVCNIIELRLGFAKTDYNQKATLNASEVAAGDTVILVAGASSKGMGGAGVNIASELARAQAFADRKDINLIVVQADGVATRGSTSDPIYPIVCAAAKVNLVVSAANNDGKFDEWCKDSVVYYYSRISNIQNSLKFVLGK